MLSLPLTQTLSLREASGLSSAAPGLEPPELQGEQSKENCRLSCVALASVLVFRE